MFFMRYDDWSALRPRIEELNVFMSTKKSSDVRSFTGFTTFYALPMPIRYVDKVEWLGSAPRYLEV